MPRKYPTSLAKAIEEIKELEARMDRLKQDISRASAQYETQCEEARSEKAAMSDALRKANAEKSEMAAKLENSRGDFKDLKERLYSAEIENARLGGYVERVYEDDIVREPTVQMAEPYPAPREVPKRPAPRRMSVDASPSPMYATARDGARARRRHWTDY